MHYFKVKDPDQEFDITEVLVKAINGQEAGRKAIKAMTGKSEDDFKNDWDYVNLYERMLIEPRHAD